MAEKQDRCWPGYEPVPGKKPHSQGSCKPKAESKSSPSEKGFRAKRRKQLDKKEAEQPGKRSQSFQHLGPPASTKKTATKKKSATPSTKRSAATAKKPAATKKSTATKSASRKTVSTAVRKRA